MARGVTRFGIVLAIAVACAFAAHGATDQAVYDEALRNGWQDWSWAGVHSLASTAYAHGGTVSMSMVPKGWEAIYLEQPATVSGADYDGLDFWINGGAAGGQDLNIVFVSGSTALGTVRLADLLPGGPSANTWKAVRVPFDTVGVGVQSFDGIYFQDNTGGVQPAVYIDDVILTARKGVPPSGTPVAVTVDPGADRHPVDPMVYGVSFMDTIPAGQPPYPLRRWGGNSTTRYNWQVDASNRGSDWFFFNIANDTDVARLPQDSSADRFIDQARAHGGEPLLTVPLIGWTPVDRVKRWGFSVQKYGAQQKTECTETGGASWCTADAGNGVKAGGAGDVTGNDPHDTSVAITPSFVTGWMAHIAGRVGTAANGGLRLYALDNEPALWNSTHRDVHPAPTDDAELWQRTVDYASAIKRQDPGALTTGPVPWGWCEYFYSARDGCSAGSDHAAHGPWLEWYLAQVDAYRRAHRVRLVDYLDIHYYPQTTGVALSDDETGATAAARLRSLKSLYDPTYTDESWIGDHVNLIPRMRDIIARNAPGTRLAITEYNWGNDTGLTSALAQVEALAIFGREGVDLAARWVAPAAGTRVEDAFRVYLDYDGHGARVTGDSVQARSASIDDVGAYAIRGADDRLFVVLVNKSTTARPVPVTVASGLAGPVDLYGFDGASRLAPKGSVTASAGTFTVEMSARSVVLAVAPLAACAYPAAVGQFRVRRSGTNIQFTWAGVAGATDYVVQEDGQANGIFIADTGTATSGTTGLTAPVPSGTRFYLVSARNGCGSGPGR